MRFFKRVVDFYIDASIHVGLAVYALVWISLLTFDISYDKALGYVVFCATVVSYNFMKFGTTAKKYFIVTSRYLKIIQVFSFVCFGVAAFYAFQLRFPTLMILALTTVLTGLYALPFLPNRTSFRSLHGVKIYVVALCWSLITVLLPVVNAEYQFSNDVAIEFVQRFLIVLVLILPFDIRDLKHDELRLGTLPQQIGIKKTKGLGITILIVFWLLSFLKDDYTVQTMWIHGVIALITGIFLLFSKENQSEYYSSLYVESIPLAWLFLVLLSNKLF